MKITKPTVILKSGKTKLVSSADKERLVQLKQQIKEAKLRLQSAKRAVREAKDGIKQAKLALKNAKKISKPTKLAQPVQAVKPVSSKATAKTAVKKTADKKLPVTKSRVATGVSGPSKLVTTARKKSTRARSRTSAVAATVEVSAPTTGVESQEVKPS